MSAAAGPVHEHEAGVVAGHCWNVLAEVFRPSVAAAVAEAECWSDTQVATDDLPLAKASAEAPETVLDASWWARRTLLPGECVEVHGLQSALVLNGRRGRIVRFVSETSRFEVRLDGDEASKGVMAANLRRIDSWA